MTNRDSHSVHRRELLKTAAGVASGIGLLSGGGSPMDDKGRVPQWIDAYPDRLSYKAGEEVQICVSTSEPNYSIEIARVGAKRERVWETTGLPGVAHEIPENASTHGCGWPVSVKIRISDYWKSGYYSVTLKATRNGTQVVRGDAFFVVRSACPGTASKILLQLTTNTYNAYNNWGGPCLYERGRLPMQGIRVSFQRPMGRGFLANSEGELSKWSPYAGWHNWERSFVMWAESSGYRLDYAVNSDLELQPELLKNYRLVLSVGHDEYWSGPMRDNLEAFISNGGNVVFFSGNVCYWQVRLENHGQTMVCYKYAYKDDPYFKRKDYGQMSTLWANHLVARPELPHRRQF